MKMLSIFVAAAALCRAGAVRPERGNAEAVAEAKISDLAEPARLMASTKLSESLAALQTASGIVNKISQESGNATAHMNEDNKKLLRDVMALVDQSIYGSMNASHKADEKSLATAIADVDQCNTDIANRLAATGDLGKMQTSVRTKQSDLNDLQGVVDVKSAANKSAWDIFNQHMSLISNPPDVPGFPARTMPSLNVYFDRSAYCLWFSAQKEAYVEKRDFYLAADKALKAAIAAYKIGKAKRDVQYCDWKTELEESCGAFDKCYSTKSAFYKNDLTPRVRSDMTARIEAFKSGETLMQQIKFLLALTTTRETPTTDTSRYEIDFPSVPAQDECDLTVLSSSEWNPVVECESDGGGGGGGGGGGTDKAFYSSCPAKANVKAKCAKWVDTLPGSPLRDSSHTVVMSLQFNDKAKNANCSQWLMNLGEEDKSANHWLYNPHISQEDVHFGSWDGGSQIRHARIGGAQTLTTTYDAATKMYSLYIDGKFSSKRTLTLDIKSGQMLVGRTNRGGKMGFFGCVEGVDVYKAALTATQVAAASQRVRSSCGSV